MLSTFGTPGTPPVDCGTAINAIRQCLGTHEPITVSPSKSWERIDIFQLPSSLAAKAKQKFLIRASAPRNVL
jgi:hypothetical protein